MGEGKKAFKQRIDGGDGNIQIGTLVVHRCSLNTDLPAYSPRQDDKDLMSLEERRDLTGIVLEIEMAEDDLIDAAPIGYLAGEWIPRVVQGDLAKEGEPCRSSNGKAVATGITSCTPAGGETPLYGSTGTSDARQAQEFHDRLKVDLWNQAKLGQRPRYTWNDAVVRYVGDRAGLETSKIHLRWLHAHLDGVELGSIDRDRVDAIAAVKRAERRTVRTRQGVKTLEGTVSAGTVRRVIGVLTAVLNAAVEWGWLDSAPKRKRAKVASQRIRWLTAAQAERLLAELPEHLADMAQFSLETGLRRANVTGLAWSQVDLVRRVAWIHPAKVGAI
ncbi:hypothetical protein CNECB9_2150002 [Cupriavidus necator]|uniref:Tyr recombinase domain-containing protein n=1 Tax=Cupriavidus necator TaxID=106590 RepID=A0A1K0ICA6_CUPNE|nr:hypothetical protein CNECB9_2150002 [Cupriavidus necator]